MNKALVYENLGSNQFVRLTNSLPETMQGLVLGPTFGDYDNDGILDVFLADHVHGSTISGRLMHSDGNGKFSLNRTSFLGDTACMAMWADYDNDGDLDVYISNGEDTPRKSSFYQNNGDGTFTQILEGNIVNDLGNAVSCAWADYDNDGFMDLFSINRGGSNRLYHNNGNSNKWLMIKLVGMVSNKAAIGAKVRTRATIFGKTVWQMREINGGNTAQNDLRAHFGLGDATQVDVVRIEWPSGRVQELDNVSAGQILTITEFAAVATVSKQDPPIGANVIFTLSVTGSVANALQWRLNYADLPGQTNAILSLTSVQTNQSGLYSALISDGKNTVTSSEIMLEVYDRPRITKQPANNYAWHGSNTTFTVTANSPLPMTYQWQINGVNIPGATTPTLTINNAQLAQEGDYSAVVSDANGSTVSTSAKLSILIIPVIIQPPVAQKVVEHGDMTVSVEITGNPAPFYYQWRRGSLLVTNMLCNERICFFTFTNVLLNQGGTYRVVITNAALTSLTLIANFTVTVLADADADGMPDQWEIDTGINTNRLNHAIWDDDNDGFINLYEYQAGCHPTNCNEHLEFSALKKDHGSNKPAQMQFWAISNKTYTVEYRDSVSTGTWQRLGDVIACATNRIMEIQDPNGSTSNQRYYRIMTPRKP